MVGLATITLSTSSVRAEETTDQSSYPLKSENAIPLDAQVLAEYARRMPFQLWQPPRAAALELRTITRHIAALTQQHTRESNRLHAASASIAGARCVQQDLKRSLCDLERRIDKLRAAALALVQPDPDLRF